MSYLEAKILDLLNVGLVWARIGRRQRPVATAAIEEYAAALPPDPFAPGVPVALQPRQDPRHPERWIDSGSGWVATRLPSLRAPATPTSALIFLHGWLATPVQLTMMRRAANRLRASGVEVWLPRLPAHIERTPAGAVSGERCLSADLVETGEALRMAVAETMALERWLRYHGRRKVGVSGISLGGWVAALALTCSSSWDVAALWVPVVDPVPTLLASPLATPIRRTLLGSGLEEVGIRRLFSGFAPLHRELRIESGHVVALGGRYDNVVDPSGLAALGSWWGVPVDWYPHGHISMLWSLAAARRWREFLLDRLG